MVIVVVVLQEVVCFGDVNLGQQIWIVGGVGLFVWGMFVYLCMNVFDLGNQCFYFVGGGIVCVCYESGGVVQLVDQVVVEVGVVVYFC